jgi:hypothetical protein
MPDQLSELNTVRDNRAGRWSSDIHYYVAVSSKAHGTPSQTSVG